MIFSEKKTWHTINRNCAHISAGTLCFRYSANSTCANTNKINFRTERSCLICHLCSVESWHMPKALWAKVKPENREKIGRKLWVSKNTAKLDFLNQSVFPFLRSVQVSLCSFFQSGTILIPSGRKCLPRHETLTSSG